jgi:hypothetical protein
MFGIDDARVADPVITSKPKMGEGLVSAKKKAKPNAQPNMPPVFSSDEKELNIQIPDGWRTH